MKIQELLKDLGVKFVEEGESEHATTGWVNIDCPFCSPDWQHYRLGINEQYLNTSCWHCGTHGLADALGHITGKHYEEIKELLKGVERQAFHTVRHYGKLVLPKGIQKLKPVHKSYLRKRGFTNLKRLERLWQIKGFTYSEEYSWRIYIPIFLEGRQVSFTARSILDKGVLRYLSCKKENEAYPHRQLLYGEEYARNAIVIVEGPMDVWKIGPGAVCTFGTGFTKAQVLRMIKYPVRAICFDNENSAQWRANELAKLLEPFPGRTLLVRLKAKDAGSADKKEIEELRKVILGDSVRTGKIQV